MKFNKFKQGQFKRHSWDNFEVGDIDNIESSQDRSLTLCEKKNSIWLFANNKELVHNKIVYKN